jgi:light-regulated signal transduction histidine kinase (bacteriophytochrome)
VLRLFEEIQDNSRQLAEASQRRFQFLANMSHELRTPLNAIIGYTELILDKVYGDTPDRMRGVLERIERNGRHLLGLINDVLDLSKIEAGQLILELGDYSLKNVVHTVFSSVEPLAKEKKLKFKVELPPELPQGHADERRLTQVLLNLVGNAIKFTDAGEIAIKASAANGSFEIAVRAILGLASRPPIRPNCSRSSSKPTIPSRARRVAPGWGSRSPSASLKCMVGAFGSSQSWARARLFLSRYRSQWSTKPSRRD